jgi:hypothetical protein
MAGRVLRVSTTFRQGVTMLGVRAGSEELYCYSQDDSGHGYVYEYGF